MVRPFGSMYTADSWPPPSAQYSPWRGGDAGMMQGSGVVLPTLGDT